MSRYQVFDGDARVDTAPGGWRRGDIVIGGGGGVIDAVVVVVVSWGGLGAAPPEVDHGGRGGAPLPTGSAHAHASTR